MSANSKEEISLLLNQLKGTPLGRSISGLV